MCAQTHVDDVGQVVDVIFEDAAVGGLQSQQVLVPGLDGFQLVLRVLGLSLKVGWGGWVVVEARWGGRGEGRGGKSNGGDRIRQW